MAVLASAPGLNVGGQILQALMLTGQRRGDQRAVLSAQVQAEGFYARYGFTRFGAEFAEADSAHIDMEHFYG